MATLPNYRIETPDGKTVGFTHTFRQAVDWLMGKKQTYHVHEIALPGRRRNWGDCCTIDYLVLVYSAEP